MADRLATRSTRIISMAPLADPGLPTARPARTARAAASASSGSDLPSLRRVPRPGRSTSTTSNSPCPQPPRQPAPIGAWTLDADPSDLSERAGPSEELLVALAVGRDRTGPESSAEPVEDDRQVATTAKWPSVWVSTPIVIGCIVLSARYLPDTFLDDAHRRVGGRYCDGMLVELL